MERMKRGELANIYENNNCDNRGIHQHYFNFTGKNKMVKTKKREDIIKAVNNISLKRASVTHARGKKKKFVKERIKN